MERKKRGIAGAAACALAWFLPALSGCETAGCRSGCGPTRQVAV